MMTAQRPERQRLTASYESLTPDPETPPSSTPEPVETPTSTLSLRVPTDLVHRVQREIRRLHFETGAPKGAIASAILEEGLAHIDAATARLSTD